MTFMRVVCRSLPALLAVSLVMAISSRAESQDSGQPTDPESARANVSQPDSTVEEVTVTGTSIAEAIDQARFSESIVDVLSAKDFAVTGDTGVVSALGRVSGVTTVGDKYVYVRGLGERYSSTLFNGALLPSPDPVRRVVPLDLFPAGVMDQLSVQKTYAPYLPADFSGGSVQLKTKTVPAEPEARLSLSNDYRTGTTFSKRTWYEGSGSDWTGYDGSYRHLGDRVGGATGLNGMTPAEIQKAGLGLNRQFDTDEKTLAPNFKLKGSYARDFDLHIGNVGFLLGGQAENKWLHLSEYRATSTGALPGQQSMTKNYEQQNRTTNAVEYSGLGVLEWKPSRSSTIDGTVFYTHNTDKRYINGNVVNTENNGVDTPDVFHEITTEWEEQTLWTTQLSGTHNIAKLHDLGADWGVTYSTASRVKPDTRFYRYDQIPYTDPADPLGTADFSKEHFDSDVTGNARSWETLTDDAWDAHGSLALPLKITSWLSSTTTAGARYFDKKRDSEARRFRFQTSFGNNMYDFLPLDDIFDDEHISPKPNDWQLNEFTRASDVYSAEEEIIGGFLQTEFEIGSKLRWMVGTRYETSTQDITTPFAPDSSSSLKDDGFHPATELTFLIRDDLQLRAGYSQTINRPDLREISPAIYVDPEDRYSYYGQPDLKVATLRNYDLRLEWYHDGPDHVQVAAFYKDIKDPIEQILQPAGNLRTWQNSKKAYLYGFEFEVRQSLAPLGRWLDDFYVRSNAAYIKSQATGFGRGEPGEKTPLTNVKHELQGQSPWIANVQLTWEDLPSDTEATIVFNDFGKRITDLGTQGIFEDAYEQPRASLDVIVRHGFELFGQDFDLTVKAKNLIDPRYEVERGGVIERDSRAGRLFSIEIGKSF